MKHKGLFGMLWKTGQKALSSKNKLIYGLLRHEETKQFQDPNKT